MTPDSLRSILNSDFKLWESADTVEEGKTVTKTMDLPYGIGEFSLTFEGIGDAGGRRNAAGIWGEAVRNEVENKISDASVTARAAQKAALSGANDGGDRTSDGGFAGGSEAVSDTKTVSAFSPPSTLAADPDRRLHELRDYFSSLRGESRRVEREIKALTAYMEVLNAQEDQTEETEGPHGPGHPTPE